MSHPYDTLDISGAGRLIFTPCPGTKSIDVEQSLLTLKQAGADMLITTLGDAELSTLGAADLGSAAKQLALAWYQLPIEDDTPPDRRFLTAWHQHKKDLLKAVEDKKTIAIHCKGGSGRTGLMAAVLLVSSGIKWPVVRSSIQSIRPKALSHPAHTLFLNRYFELGGNNDH